MFGQERSVGKNIGVGTTVQLGTEVVLLLAQSNVKTPGTVSNIGVENVQFSLVVEVDLNAVKHVWADITRHPESCVAHIETVLAIIKTHLHFGFNSTVNLRDICDLLFNIDLVIFVIFLLVVRWVQLLYGRLRNGFSMKRGVGPRFFPRAVLRYFRDHIFLFVLTNVYCCRFFLRGILVVFLLVILIVAILISFRLFFRFSFFSVRFVGNTLFLKR